MVRAFANFDCLWLAHHTLTPPFNTFSGVAKFKGDGHCDDSNNNCGACIHPRSTFNKPTGSIQRAMLVPEPTSINAFCVVLCVWVFQIRSFRAGCNWDAGDCCGVTSYKFCKECKCKDCNYKPAGDKCVKVIKSKCAKPFWKGDGRCDDDNNNAGCDWGKL